jgi:hypothetical protein
LVTLLCRWFGRILQGPELEEVEGDRCDGVVTEPQRREKEVPVT